MARGEELAGHVVQEDPAQPRRRLAERVARRVVVRLEAADVPHGANRPGCPLVEGAGDVDASLINGESLPAAAAVGSAVFAGTMNLTAPLILEVSAVGEDTLLAEIVRLVEVAEQGRARYVALADRVARWYAPTVHTLAAITFLGWLTLGGAPWRDALITAIAVLIVTCPCALGLAVPVVQVITSGRLLRRGILVKSGTALERLAAVDTVVFDKTGTLTEGRMTPVDLGSMAPEDIRLAASLATARRHPLARALGAAAPGVAPAPNVREVAGRGLALATPAGQVRLGAASGAATPRRPTTAGPRCGWPAPAPPPSASPSPTARASTPRPSSPPCRNGAAPWRSFPAIALRRSPPSPPPSASRPGGPPARRPKRRRGWPSWRRPAIVC